MSYWFMDELQKFDCTKCIQNNKQKTCKLVTAMYQLFFLKLITNIISIIRLNLFHIALAPLNSRFQSSF